MRIYTAIIERCPDTGLFVGFIPGFPGAHTQGETLDELNQNLREVVEMLHRRWRAHARSGIYWHSEHRRGVNMGNLPVLKPREIVALLAALGFSEIRQRGSHKQFRHPDGRGTTVPFHAGRDVSPILLRQIAKDIGLTVDELLNAKA